MKHNRMILPAVLALICAVVPVAAVDALPGASFPGAGPTAAEDGDRPLGYAEYRERFGERPGEAREIVLTAAECRAEAGDVRISKDRVEISGDAGILRWTFRAPAEGFFAMEFTYATAETGQGKIDFSARLDGEYPYDEWRALSLTRPYTYDETVGADFPKDSRGNDLKPGQRLYSGTVTEDLRDADGKFADPLRVFLTPGEHTLTLEFTRGRCAVERIRFYVPVEPKSYGAYLEEHRKAGATDTSGLSQVIRAEMFSKKSDSAIQPDYDKSGAATLPSAANLMLLNKIGGVGWQKNGQWIEWTFEVEESGFYCISFRARQNVKYGKSVIRRILLDSEIPFAEMKEQHFPYHRKWYVQTLSGEEPYRFYLEAGRTHVLRAEIVSGSYETAVLDLRETLTALNTLYRKIIMVTGPSPDPYRDYEIDTGVPNLIPMLENIRRRLSDRRDALAEGLIETGSETTALDTLIVQIDGFLKDIDTVPYQLNSFKTNIGALADWVSTLSDQPLELDSVVVHSPDRPPVKADAGFLRELRYKLQVVASSFADDYGLIGNYADQEKAVKVWMNSGRDQLRVLKSMVDRSFSPKSGIPVHLSLVSGGLIEAVLAGKGPDAALFVGSADPVNLAARNAVTPLDDLEGFETVCEDFYPANLVPFRYRGKTYALPCTAEFPMMFVRTDVLADLGIPIPKTWDDLISAAAVLQRKNLQVGLPSAVAGNAGFFPVFLVQRGLTFYDEDFTRTRFREEAAIEAFSVFTDFYTKYDFPLAYNFFNRFRTGEMPIGLESYTLSNYIRAAAPEISGLWEMTGVPATRREDGTLCDTVTNQASAAAVVLKTDRAENAWRFLRWFVSTETQAEFGTETEAVLGPSGRYATANKNALRLLPWSADEAERLLNRWSRVTDPGVIPATYIVERNLSNAFKKAVYNRKNAREVLTTYSLTMDEEIARKNRELERRAQRGKNR